MLKKLCTVKLIIAALIIGISLPVLAQDAAQTAEVTKKLLENVGDNSHRLDYHLDSLIAIALLIMVLVMARLFNASSAQQRRLGTFLAAAACLSIAFSIAWLNSLEALDRVKDPLFPIDKLKPTAMIIWLWATAVTGAALFFIAVRQNKSSADIDTPTLNQTDSYGRVSRFIHWSMASLFILMIPMGIFTSMIPEDVWYRNAYYVVHKSLGLTLLGLIVVRLYWNIKSPRPKQDPQLKNWELKSAKIAHFMLYVLMLGFPISGFILSTFAGKYSHFFFWDLPLLWGPDQKLIIPFALLHKVALPAVFYLVFVAHLAGVLKHRYMDKNEKSIQRMIG